MELLWFNGRPAKTYAGVMAHSCAKLRDGFSTGSRGYEVIAMSKRQRAGMTRRSMFRSAAAAADAPGGAMDYVVKGAMIGGFAMVAWPAEYGVSGIQTLIVNHTGIVYEKDLGSQTATLARQMTRFNPDKTWKPVVGE